MIASLIDDQLGDCEGREQDSELLVPASWRRWRVLDYFVRAH